MKKSIIFSHFCSDFLLGVVFVLVVVFFSDKFRQSCDHFFLQIYEVLKIGILANLGQLAHEILRTINS